MTTVGQDRRFESCQPCRLCPRYCCKTRKLQRHEFFAKRRGGRRLLIRIPSIALPKSPVSLTRGDMSPHIFTPKTRLQPAEFLITCAKRLLQQYPLNIDRTAKTTTLSARYDLCAVKNFWDGCSFRPVRLRSPHRTAQACPHGDRVLAYARRKPLDGVPMTAVAEDLPPRPKPVPNAPGLFALADPEHVTGFSPRQAGRRRASRTRHGLDIAAGRGLEEAMFSQPKSAP
jgi:hypothetical protein